MKFGVRDITDVVFKAKTSTKIGSRTFAKGQPVLLIDSATASNLEQATTTVYAQGGRGNSRLIAWDGDKTLTFTITDALLSPIGLALLSSAFTANSEAKQVHVRKYCTTYISIAASEGEEPTTNNKLEIDVSDVLEKDETIDDTAPVFICYLEDESITGEIATGYTVEGKKLTKTDAASAATEAGKSVYVDFYVVKDATKVSELQIRADSFGCNFYVEANTYFRRETDSYDMPVILTIPNAKIQSNFTLNFAATGDPSTFDFTLDAFPGYIMFDKNHKVLCVMQIVNDSNTDEVDASAESVMPHPAGFDIKESASDSTEKSGESNAKGK